MKKFMKNISKQPQSFTCLTKKPTVFRIDKDKCFDIIQMRVNQNWQNQLQIHTPMREKLFKIYKYDVDNHVLFPGFFQPYGMKI